MATRREPVADAPPTVKSKASHSERVALSSVNVERFSVAAASVSPV